jgi:Xaa-Pro aminopeptidase
LTTRTDSEGRIHRLQTEMAQQHVDLVAIAPTVNMRYLLGFASLADERPCFLLLSPSATALVVPALNADQLEAHTGLPAVRWTDADGPRQAMSQALATLEVGRGVATMAVDNTMRADALLLLLDMVAPAQSMPADTLMAALRMVKSEAEIEVLARSAKLADDALLAGVAACRPGATEHDVAKAIADHFRQNGAESVEFTIVASGPNGAFPHHETGQRQLQTGDTIVVDIGASLDGYKSDITRMVHLGEPSAQVLAAFDAVREANLAGQRAAVAGARAGDVDLAARQSLERAGYGPYFVHRTGHGLGMEVHEPPWISSESDTIIQPGMVFSIEPGVYLPGKFGIRIEDIVVVQPEGPCRNLTGLAHDLMVCA